MWWVAIFNILWIIFGDRIKALIEKLLNKAANQMPHPDAYGNKAEATLALIDRAILLAKHRPLQRAILYFMRRTALKNGELVAEPLSSLAAEEAKALVAVGSQEQEVIDGIKRLVEIKYEGDYRKAFDSYDSDKDGSLSENELVGVFVDAEVGSRFSRWLYARETIKALDMLDKNGKIEWKEFEERISAT